MYTLYTSNPLDQLDRRPPTNQPTSTLIVYPIDSSTYRPTYLPIYLPTYLPTYIYLSIYRWTGVLLDRATLVWEGSSKIASTKKDGASGDQNNSNTGWLGVLTERWRRVSRKIQYLLARFDGVSASAAARVLQGAFIISI